MHSFRTHGISLLSDKQLGGNCGAEYFGKNVDMLSCKMYNHCGYIFFLIRHVSQATSQLLTKPTSSIIIFGILPLVYYIFDYVSSVYTTLLYSGKEIVVEFMGFVLCISYIIFIFLYFKQYEEKRDAENLNILMEMKRKQSEKEIEAIKKSETSVRILRHDLRQFLLNIHAYIENGETDKALNYINKIICDQCRKGQRKRQENRALYDNEQG